LFTDPILIKTQEFVKDVACGSSHSLALTDDGNVLIWGAN